MCKLTTSVLTMLFALIFSQIVSAQSNNKVIHIILIDQTRSMIGEGDGKGIDIWEDVKKSIKKYVQNIDKNDSLIILTYTTQINKKKHFSVETDFVSITDYITNLQVFPEKTATGIYNSMEECFKLYVDSTQRQLIYLFTDGRDNFSSISFQSVVNRFNANCGELDHCYYIDLRGSISQDIVQIINNNENFSLIEPDDIENFFPVSLSLMFDKISYNINTTNTLTQRFSAVGTNIPDTILFKTKFNSSCAFGNIVISNGNNLMLVKKESNLFEWVFNLEAYNKTNSKNYDPIELEVTLLPIESNCNFIPNTFIIQLFNYNPDGINVNNSKIGIK